MDKRPSDQGKGSVSLLIIDREHPLTWIEAKHESPFKAMKVFQGNTIIGRALMDS